MSGVITAKGISSLAIPLLARRLVLPMTVARVPGGEFSGDNGDTITIRVPQPGAASVQNTPSAEISYDDVNEVGVDVSLSHIYHAKRVSDEELTLDIVDFASQITAVQVDAVARGAENTLATEINNVAADTTNVDGSSAQAVRDAILQAAEALSDNDVPEDDRYFAIGTGVRTAILNIPEFVRVDASGDDASLRQAIVGQLFGFTFVVSPALDKFGATAYHRTGFAMANRAPVAPRGANDSASVSEGGLALRQIFQYVPDRLSDASVVSTFAGSKLVDADRVFKFELANGS